jgi:hypothetical protein
MAIHLLVTVVMFMLHRKMLQRSKFSYRSIRGGVMVLVAIACLASLLLIIPTALE